MHSLCFLRRPGVVWRDLARAMLIGTSVCTDSAPVAYSDTRLAWPATWAAGTTHIAQRK